MSTNVRQQIHEGVMQIPKYALNAPRNRLVRFLCKTMCRATRVGEVSKMDWNANGVKNDPELYVTCLKCGGRQQDVSNWVRVG